MAVCSPALFKAFFDHLSRRLSPAQVEEALQEVEAAGDRSPGEVKEEDRKRKGLLRRWGEKLWSPFRELARAGRRVYRGLRTTLAAAVKALARGVGWLGGQLHDLVGPVRALFRTILKSARGGVGIFYRGLERLFACILRRPVGEVDPATRSAVITDFDLDADALTGVLGPASPEMIGRHFRLLGELARGAGLLLTVAVTAVRSLAQLASGPVGWLTFLLRIGSAVRQVIREWEWASPEPAAA